MTDFNTDMNVQSEQRDAITLIDEVSSTEIYVGISNNGSNIFEPFWRIKKIIKNGKVDDLSVYNLSIGEGDDQMIIKNMTINSQRIFGLLMRVEMFLFIILEMEFFIIFLL